MTTATETPHLVLSEAAYTLPTDLLPNQHVVYTGCLAISADGKIHPAHTPGSTFVKLGSPNDIAHLLAVRAHVDALIFGGETFRAYPKWRSPQQYDDSTASASSHQPLQVLLTRGGEACVTAIPPTSPAFTHSQQNPLPDKPPFWIVSQHEVPARGRAQYPTWVRWLTLPTETPQAQWLWLDSQLAAAGIRTASVEGGGQIVGWALQAQALQQLYLTLCPWLLGQGATPLVEGLGFSRDTAPRLTLTHHAASDNELFLVYHIRYPHDGLSLATR